MKKLDPKSKWLFTLNTFIAVIPVTLIFFGTFIMGFLSEVPVEEGAPALPVIKSADLWVLVAIVSVIVLLIAILVPILYGLLSYKYYGYELTSESIKKERGIISKKYTSIPYARIQNVDIYRNLFARMLGLSELRIQTAGDSMGVKFSEGILPGLDKDVAEKLRDELVKKATASKSASL